MRVRQVPGQRKDKKDSRFVPECVKRRREDTLLAFADAAWHIPLLLLVTALKTLGPVGWTTWIEAKNKLSELKWYWAEWE